MLICPVCSCSNPDGSISCEQCNSAFEGTDQTIAADRMREETSARASLDDEERHQSASEFTNGYVVAGRYQIIRCLGQGGMGTVYEAFDAELERTIALKTIRPDLAANSAALRRLKQETLLTRQIAHRNVVRVFDLGVAGPLRFITMEFVDGADLRSLLVKRGKFPPKEAVALMQQVCEGLQAAHAEDVIHRDLKPQNILVGRDRRARIVDFGLARSFEHTGITRTGAVLGTPHYMAPEQAMGKQSDARSDIFALGVVFFEVLTGELPFPAESVMESFLARTRDRARPIAYVDPAVPHWLARIVMRCLERDPAHRYQTVQHLLEDLKTADGLRSASRASDSGIFAPGMILGSRYLIEAEAGEGGMGKVYRARDLDLDRTIALKVVRPELSGQPETLSRLKHEISLASQISHKNVLRIHDLGEAGGLRFVSMAWADGEDLGHLLQRYGRLPEERLVQLAIEICEGLAAAHDQGIVHRDLKPSNILLDSAGHACIADFGLARPLEIQQCLTRDGEVHGTPRYMSPEQAEGKLVDARSDIYSLGLILYEMATGKIPFKDDSVFQTLALRVAEAPENPKHLNPALSEKLAAIILRCLERDPRNRYASAHELLADLRQTEAQRIASELRAGRRAQIRSKRGWIYTAFGVAAAIVIAVAVFFFYQRATTPRPLPSKGKYIAVLPFRTLSADPNLRYEAEGIADSVSSRLFALNGIHPISTSALERVDLAQPEAPIGRQLGANLIVSGTVQGAGDRIQVIANIDQLEAKTQRRIWSQPFTGLRADLFTLEEEIATQIVAALNITPTTEERERAALPPTQNLAAYDLYLKGRDILKNRRDADGANSARALFEEACAKDPDFALAWTGVADASLLLYRTTKEGFWAEKALVAAREANRRNDNLPEAYFALGSVYTETGKNAEAVEEIKHALRLAPNSDDGYIRLGHAYAATGQTEAALAAYKKAVELNPYYWYNHKQLGGAYADIGNNQEALKEFQKQIDLNPKEWSGYNNIGAIYSLEGRWKDCIPYLEKAIELHPSFDSYSNLGSAYYELGRYPEAIQMYEKAVQLNGNSTVALRNLAQAYRRAGQEQQALSTYDRAITAAYSQLQINPQNAEVMGTLAMCYAAKGDLSRARQLIQRARSIDGADSGLMYDEAVVLSLQGRLPEALTSLQRALQNGTSLEDVIKDPDLKAVRDLPKFKAVVKMFGQTADARRR